MNECPRCGYHPHQKYKLTLGIDHTLVERARDSKLNISQFLERKLVEELEKK